MLDNVDERRKHIDFACVCKTGTCIIVGDIMDKNYRRVYFYGIHSC